MRKPLASFGQDAGKRFFYFLVGLLLSATPLGVWAAPNDVFLSATPEQQSPRGFIDVSSDHMNGALDFFRVRDSDPLTAGTSAGDYLGAHVTGGIPLGDALWLSGSLWQRNLKSASDSYNYTSWQIAGQYRLIDAQDWQPALAIRLSAWGDYASATESSTAVVVPGAKLNTVKITDPADRQLQADLIGSWNLSPSTDVNVLLSAGSSQLSYGALSATTTRNGCEYQVAFTGNNIYGTLAAPCNVGGGVIQQFFDSSGAYGVDVANEISWRGTFMQAGVNASWRHGPWTVMGGYLFYVAKRDNVDAILIARGKPSYTQNHFLSVEARYRIHNNLQVYGRGQLTSNLYLSDLPVIYNTSTSDRFGSKYSLFSLGLRLNF